MRCFYCLFVFAAFAFASEDGSITDFAGILPGVQSTDNINLTVLDDWTMAKQVYGLDYYTQGSFKAVMGVDNDSGYVYAYSPYTGQQIGDSLHICWANPNCFGVAWNNDEATPGFLTNDWLNTDVYYTEDFGYLWTSYPNPSGKKGRGMDFDGTEYWITNGNAGGIWHFRLGLSSEHIPTPEVPSQASGLTVFPYNGDTGIAITTYGTHYIYFYSWDGTSITYLGSSECPVACLWSFGLAYDDSTDHLFWSYQDPEGNYHLAKLSFEISSFVNSTWGSLKSSF